MEEVIEAAFQKVWPNGDSRMRDYIRPFVSEFVDSNCADSHYLVELDSGDINKVAARVWEAMLYARFKAQQWSVTSAAEGPDFFLETQNGSVQVEAVIATPGDADHSGLSREWQERSTGKAYAVPHEQILTRWTNAIANKRTKFLNDVKRDTANEACPFVIAVNSCLLGSEQHDISGAPMAAAAVLPFGPQTLTINVETGETIDSGLQWRESIKKSNNAEVRMDSFLDDQYSCVSAVLGCSSLFVDEADRERFAGQPPYIVIHNPKAKHPLPLPWLSASIEYTVRASDAGEVELKRIQ